MLKDIYYFILQPNFLDHRDAGYGHRTPSKREQEDARGNANEMFFGYKLHAIADAESDMPVGFFIAQGNRYILYSSTGCLNMQRERSALHLVPNCLQAQGTMQPEYTRNFTTATWLSHFNKWKGAWKVRSYKRSRIWETVGD